MSSSFRRTLVAFGMAALFALFALVQGLGYYADATVTSIEKHPRYGYGLATVNCSVIMNPFLYPLSWLTRHEFFQGSITMIVLPEYYTGGEAKFPVWPTIKDVATEGVLSVITPRILMNFSFNFAILLAVELKHLRDLYLCLLGGVIGFPIGGVSAAFVGFSVVTFLVYIIRRVRRRGVVDELLDYILQPREDR